MSDSNKIYESNATWFQNSQGNYQYFITYGTDRQRSMSRLINGITEDILQTKYYAFGDYEKEITPTGTRHLHYISGGDGLAAIYVKYSNAPDSLYFIMTDHLGSIVGAINSATGTVYRQNFDAWGRKRNPQTWSYTNIPDFPFDRGYTGHEHLKWFGLINMNGRMYDAALCRFLSPDSYIQMPDYTQNFNRYSYALNNPLIYSDPSGEFLQVAFFAMAMVADYSANLINGVNDPIGTAYSNVSTTINGINNCGQITVYNSENTRITAGINPFIMGVSANMYHRNGNATYHTGIGIGFTSGIFVDAGVTYNAGNFSLSASGGYSSGQLNIADGSRFPGGSRLYGGGTYFDQTNNQSFSGGLTYFGGEYSQYNWFGGYQRGDFSFSMTNDAWTGSDKYRTAAAEIGIGDFSYGFNLFTTAPPENEYNLDPQNGSDKAYVSPIWGKNPLNTYSSGSRVFAGMYLGYGNGNNMSRIGVDAPWVQDFFQNGIHRYFVKTPYFNTKYGPPFRFFGQGGYSFPYSLYNF